VRVGPRLIVTHHSFMRGVVDSRGEFQAGRENPVVSLSLRGPAVERGRDGRESLLVAVMRVWWCWVRQIRAGRRHVDPARSGRRRFVFVDPARSPPRRPDAMTRQSRTRGRVSGRGSPSRPKQPCRLYAITTHSSSPLFTLTTRASAAYVFPRGGSRNWRGDRCCFSRCVLASRPREGARAGRKLAEASGHPRGLSPASGQGTGEPRACSYASGP